MIDIEQVKKKILSILNQKGPSLPVQIAREIKLEPMFASAILAELANSKQVKISNLKIGSSPLYLIPGQEEKLESFADTNLEGAGKEAFLKLKQSKILKDESQSPVIRVALRSIRDFAFPFKHNNKIFWKYVFIPDEEIEKLLSKRKILISPKQTFKKSDDTLLNKKSALISERNSPKLPKQPKRKSNFLEEIKEFLNSKNIQLLNTIEINKKQITAKININGKPYLLVAYNKKRLVERDIVNAHKKASELNLRFYILGRGNLTKKMTEAIEAYHNLLKVDKLQQQSF